MTAKEFSAVARKVGAEYRTMKMSERIAAMKPREMTATEVAASRYADEIRCRMAGIPVAPPLPSGLYDEGFVRMHGTARAAGHNPHGLTVAQVGAGWRLLAKEEIIDGMRSPDDRLAIEMWEISGWSSDWNGNSVGDTYRTKKPPGYYMPFESEVRKFAKKRGPGTWEDIAEACCSAAEVVAAEKVRKKLTELSATDAEAKCPVVPTCPPPAGTKYVHTFVCHACPRTCTMETVSTVPHFYQFPSDMLCPFRLPGCTAIWKAGPVHTLTP